MRYALLGDVHGNLEALDAVLAACSTARIDRFIFLGDLVGYGADPNACCQCVRALDPIAVVGNHDAAAIGRLDTSYFNPHARRAMDWCREALDASHADYLRRLPYVVRVDGGPTVFHATLHDPEAFGYITDEIDATMSFRCLETQLGIFGHSHVPDAFRQERSGAVERIGFDLVALAPDARFLVNPGSVGQPRDGDPRASFGILDTDAWTVTTRRVPYDIETAQRKIRAAGLPRLIYRRLAIGH